MYPGARRGYSRVFLAPEGTSEIEVFFQSEKGCEAWDVSVTPCSWREAAAYCDKVWAEVPRGEFALGRGASSVAGRMPRLMAALEGRRKARVLLLGDSIVQDTFHSQFHALLRRSFPDSKAEWLVSVRGGTGCWYYKDPEAFAAYVTRHSPDVVLIGGISSWNAERSSSAGDADIEAVGELCEKAGIEVGVMSPALSFDRRLPAGSEIGAPVASRHPSPEEITYFAEEFGPCELAGLSEICARRGWGYLDMTTPCYTWLFESGTPYQWHSRDFCHSGERGKQVIARALCAALSAAPVACGKVLENK